MNRCKSDVDANISHQASREKEANFFATHPVYSELPQTCFGCKVLTEKIASIQLMRIRPNMQDIVADIHNKLAESEK